MKRLRKERNEDPLQTPASSKIAKIAKSLTEDKTDSEKIDVILEKVANIEKTLTSAVNLLHQLTEDYVLPSREAAKDENRSYADRLEDNILPPQPFADLTTFLQFEDKIKDEYNFQALVKDFSKTNAKHSAEYVAKCWRKIFVDSLAKAFSWQGTSEKGTVRMLATTAALSSAFKKKFPLDRYTIFEDKTKKFFQYAKDRETKIMKYKEKSMIKKERS